MTPFFTSLLPAGEGWMDEENGEKLSHHWPSDFTNQSDVRTGGGLVAGVDFLTTEEENRYVCGHCKLPIP